MFCLFATLNSRARGLWGLSACVLFFFVLASPVHAGYKPPFKKSVPSGPMTLTGRRNGCRWDGNTVLTALTPQTHVGHSLSSHPVFTWYVPEGHTMPLEFHLYQTINGNKKSIFKTTRKSHPGFMFQKLPATLPALSVGNQYQWQVTTQCHSERTSKTWTVDAEIVVVAPSPELMAKLSDPLGKLARSNILAEYGLWYDAMGELANAERLTHYAELRLIFLQQLAALESRDNNQIQSLRLQRLIAEENRKESPRHCLINIKENE